VFGSKYQLPCHNFTSPRSSLCHKLYSSHCTCNLFLRPVRVFRDHIKRSLHVLPFSSFHPWIFRPTAHPSFLACARRVKIAHIRLLSFLRVRPLPSLHPPFSSRWSRRSVRIIISSPVIVTSVPPNLISLLNSKTLDYFPLPLRKQHFLFGFFLLLHLPHRCDTNPGHFHQLRISFVSSMNTGLPHLTRSAFLPWKRRSRLKAQAMSS